MHSSVMCRHNRANTISITCIQPGFSISAGMLKRNTDIAILKLFRFRLGGLRFII